MAATFAHRPLLIICSIFLLIDVAISAADSGTLASELIRAEADSRIEPALEAHKAELNPELCAALLTAGDDARDHADYKKAASIYSVSRRVAEVIQNKPAIADSLNRLAVAYKSLGEAELQSQSAAEALKLSREAGYQRGIADALISTGDISNNNGKTDDAIASYQESLKIYESITDKAGIATSLNSLGTVLTDQGSYQKADDYFRRSLTLREEVGDKRKVAVTLNDIAANFYSQGEFYKALDFFSQSLKQSEALNDKKQIAVVTFNLGATYQNFGAFRSALDSYHKALQMMQELGLQENLYYVLFGIGSNYKNLGNYPEALSYYQQGLALSRKINDQRAMSFGFCHIAAVYLEEGNYGLAANYSRQCVDLRESAGLRDGLADALGDLGKIYLRQGNSELAFQSFQKAFNIAQELGQKQDAGIILNLRGYSYYLTGDYERATEDYNTALTLTRGLNDKLDMSMTLRNLGYLYLAEGKLDASQDTFQQNLTLAQEMDSKNRIADALNGLSELYLARNECEKSVDAGSRSAKLAEEIVDPEIQWQAWTTLGKCQLILNRTTEAHESLDRAIHVIDGMRLQSGGGEEEHQRFFENKLSPYDVIVKLLLHENKYEEALQYAERAKARVLDDVMNQGKIEIKKAMSSQEQDQERHWIEELVSLNTEIRTAKQNAKPDEVLLSKLNAQLTETRSSYEAFRSALYDAHPELRVKRAKTEPPKPAEFNDLEQPHVFLEYTVTDSETFLFVIKQDPARDAQLKVFRIQVARKDLAKQVDNFRMLLSRRSPGFASPAQSLYDLLIKPAEPEFESRSALIIVPDRELWGLPFQALMDQRGDYLLEKYEMSYVPSLTILRDMRQMKKQQKPSGEEKLLAFGNPLVATSVAERAGYAYRDHTLAPIPETETEVKALLQLYGTGAAKIYTGEAASEGAWKEHAGQYDILHLAAHGILDSSSPLYSHVVLSHPAAETNEDGLLEAWEIMQMNLSADLVVLSACETALGRIGAGEGMIGLSWAFFVAGSKATLVSQWKVESESTADLMLAFYKNLRSGASKARALHLAAQSLSRQNKYRHPFCWAGFILIGDTK